MNPAMRDLFLGGEDEEVQDFTPPYSLHRSDATSAYLNIDVRSEPDGTATVWLYTNDFDADGKPDREGAGWEAMWVSWTEQANSLEEAIERYGPSRVEPNGRVITLHVNGRAAR